jgi:predicted Zn finger-like uncharacterized protein
MLITCPNCQASYTVADTALGEKGRSVRCAKCKQVWHAAPPPPAMAEPAAEEWQPSVDEWKPSTDEWKPSTEEWQPTVDQPADDVAATPAEQGAMDDGAWPQSSETGESPLHMDDAPPVVPEDDAAASESAALSKAEIDYQEIRRRKAARIKAQKERGLGIKSWHVAVALASILIGLFVMRESVVKFWPQTASLYGRLGFHINVRGLDFAGLKTSYETQEGTRVLIVEGDIRNISRNARPVANLNFALRNAAGVDVYNWGGVPDRNVLKPGEVTQFRSRVAAPPHEGRDVRVTFAPNDPAAGKP